MRIPIHRDGVPIIAGFITGAALLWAIYPPLGWVAAPVAAWSVWFFRDPEREAPGPPGAVLCPADGRLLPVVEAVPPPELEMGPESRTRISVFMNIFDVHVNRIPADGTVTAVAYRPGRFFNASFDKASEANERLSVRMRTRDGHDLAFVQIAGLLARRIRSRIAVGDRVRAGERFGIIRFGSRVDVYLPTGMRHRLRDGQRMVAGRTVIAPPDDSGVSGEAG